MRLRSNVLISAYAIGLRVAPPAREQSSDREQASGAGAADYDPPSGVLAIADHDLRSRVLAVADHDPPSEVLALADDEPASGVLQIGVGLTEGEPLREDAELVDLDDVLQTVDAAAAGEVIEDLPEECILPDDAPVDEPPSGVVPLARIAISRRSIADLEAEDVREVQVILRVSAALCSVSAAAHATLTLADGTLLHEAVADANGRVTATLLVPRTQREVRALLDTGSKHRSALLRIANDAAEYTFR